MSKGKQNFYFCNKSEYEKTQSIKNKDKLEKEELQMIIDKIFGEAVVNTCLYKEILEWKKIKEMPIIISYLQENQSSISNSLSKNFQSEYAKIRYFSAIVKNNIKN